MNPLLFGVITGPNFQAAEAALSASILSIHGIELRLDYFEEFDIEEVKAFIACCPLPVMLTLRRQDQGGRFQGSEEERLNLLKLLCQLKPAFIDLEFDVPATWRKKLFESYPHISFLSSYHDFHGMPDDLEAVYSQVKTPHAHIYKIAVTANSSLDALKVLCFAKSHSNQDKIIAIAMGDYGHPSRILAPVVGTFLTYAPLGDSTAPGQLTADELQSVYRFSKLNRNTQVFSLIGDPVDKSLGALIHNAVFEDANLNAVYIKIPLKKEEISAFFNLCKHLPFKGFSITMPHKEAVLAYLTQPSSQVKNIGACNTIHVVDHKLLGFNTDGIGALNAIEKRIKVKGKRVVFIGAGGAAKALIYEAAERGAQITILNRTPEKAIDLALSCNGRGGGWELFPEACKSGYDVIVNCIPDSDQIEEDWILPGKIAMDIVYVPKDTPFLMKAKRQKCQIVYGYEMFAQQALEQERIWFLKEIDLGRAYTIIEKVVRQLLCG